MSLAGASAEAPIVDFVLHRVSTPDTFQMRYAATYADTWNTVSFTELGLYYPALLSQRPVFEAIANDVIPALRESRKPSK